MKSQFGGEEVPQGHKDEFDPNLPIDGTEEVPGKPGIKNPETGEVVTLRLTMSQNMVQKQANQRLLKKKFHMKLNAY